MKVIYSTVNGIIISKMPCFQAEIEQIIFQVRSYLSL